MDWTSQTVRVTAILLAASTGLIAAGVAGLGGSLALAAVFACLGGLFFVGRGVLGRAPRTLGHDFGEYGTTLWLGPLAAAVVVVVALGATPAELQALGGLVGLGGMLNYFLQPLYRLVHALVGRLGFAD
jgi:hypothetical protein